MSSVDASSFTSPLASELAEVLDPAGFVDPDRFAGVKARLATEERWADLAALYDSAVARAPSPESGRQYLLEAGQLWVQRLESPRQAESRVRRVLATEPVNAAALTALIELCVASDRLAEAADLLDRAIEVADQSDKPDLLLRLAGLVYPGLDDANRALLALRYAYECDPTRVDVVSAARRVFLAERRWSDAKRVLDDQAEVVGAPDAAAGEDEVPVGSASDAEPQDTVDMAGAPPDGEAGQAIRAIGDLADGYLELGLLLLPHATEHDLAEACLERARELGQEAALSRLDELAHLRQSWEEAAERLRSAGFESRDKEQAAQCYLQAAELVYAYGQDPVRADELIERCMLLMPGYPPALDFLESVHTGQGRLADLARRLNGMVAAVRDPRGKVEILMRVARLSESALSEGASTEAAKEARGAALNAYRRVLAIRPDHRRAVERSGALLVEEERFEEYAVVLETYLAATSDAYPQIRAHLELGRLYLQRLEDSERSRAHFEAVLTRDASNFVASRALRALYRDAGEHIAQLGVLRVLLTYAPDRGARLDMLHQMAEVARAVGPDERLSVLRQLFELDPARMRTDWATAAEQLQRYLPLAQSYATVAQISTGPAAVEMWLAAGRLYDERLPRPREAINAYREALKLDPRNDEARSALERLLGEQDDPEALIEVLLGRIDGAETTAERALLMARIGAVQDRDLGRTDEAATTFEAVLQLDPQHPAALANLDDLHRRLGHHEELEKILVRREAVAESDDDKSALMVRRARLLAGPLEKTDEAASVFLELLARVPDDPQVIEGLAGLIARNVQPLAIARALEPIYSQRGQYGPQVDMLARLAEYEDSVEARTSAARRAAQIAETRLNDPGRAFELVAEGLRQAPDHEALLPALIRLGRETGIPEASAEVLASLTAAEQRPEVVAALAYRLGELREDPLGDPEGAIEAYRGALDADAQHGQALAALERLLGQSERYQELAELLKTRLHGTQDPAAKIQYGLALANLQDSRLDEPAQAADTLRSLLAEAPTEGAILGRLAELLERSQQWRELVQVLDRLRDSSEDPDVRVSVESKAGVVLAQHLADSPAAIERYRAALGLRPDHPPAIRGLEALLDDEEHRGAAGAILAPVYEASGDPAATVRALQAQLSAVREPETRRALFLRVVRITADELDDPGTAFEVLTRAFQEGLVAHDALQQLADLAALAHRSKELAQVYEYAVEQSPDDTELLRALARLYDGAAGAPARAKDTWQRLVDRDPSDLEALEALERLTAAGDRPEALAVVLVARAEAADDPETAVKFFKRAAAVFEQTAEDIPQALKVLERARELRPDDRSIWQELGRYYRLTDRKADLRDAMVAEVSLIEAPLERARVSVALAEVYLELGDDQGAIETYRGALEAQPDHVGARTGLEALLDGAHAKEAAEALEPVYRRVGDWARLVETYETMVDRAAEPSERVERLVAIRSIYEERLGRPDQAFRAATRAFVEAPEQAETLEALERLGIACGQVEDMMVRLQKRADALPAQHPARAALRAKLAGYAENKLGDRRRAIAIWEQAYNDQPSAREPLLELDRLYAQDGDAREQVGVQKRLATLADDAKARADHLVSAAAILEGRLGDRASAAFEYEQVLQQLPGHPRALEQLEQLYNESRAYHDLARVLEAAARHRSGLRRAESLFKLAQLRHRLIEDPRGAVTAYGEVLDMDPASAEDFFDKAVHGLNDLMNTAKDTLPELAAEAGQRLEIHWAERGETTKLVAAKEAQIAGTIDRPLRKRLLLEVAGLYERELQKPEMAFMGLARAFALFPNDSDLAEALGRLAEASGTEEELADVYGQAVPSISDPALALRLARRAASIYDHRLDRPEAAIPLYNRVLGLSVDDPEALEALERLYQRTENAAGLLTVYRGLLRRAGDDAETSEPLWRRLAEVADTTDDDTTFEAYRALLERKPDDLTLLRKMAALCERTRRLEDLWKALEREAEVVEGDERAQVFLRMGSLARNDLHDDVQAVMAFSKALEVRPEDPGAIAGLAAVLRDEGPARPLAAAALAPVYRASGAFEQYITCLEIQAGAAAASADKKRLFLEITDVYEARLGRPERAFTWGCRALHEDLTDGSVRARVERLAERTDLMEDLVGFYLDELDGLRSPDLALALRRRVAEVYDLHLEQPGRAIEEYNQVLDMAPGDAEALLALERLLPQAGEFGSLGDVYRRRIAQSGSDEERVRLLGQFAELQATQLGDRPGAIASLRRSVELKPDDVSALRLMAELCDAEDRTTELADVLERLVEVARADTSEGRDARVRLAQVNAGRGDLGAAEQLLRAVVAESPSHPGALEFLQERFEDAVAEDDPDTAERFGELLSDALRAIEAWPDLISVLRVRAGLRGGRPIDRVGLNREAAQLYRDQLGQPELAFQAFSQVLRDAPGLEDVRSELEALGEQLGQHEALAEALKEAREQAPDPEVRTELDRRIARIVTERMRDPELAARWWQIVLADAPRDAEALANLDSLFTDLGRWAGLTDVLERRAELVEEDADAQFELLVRLASIWDEWLGEREESVRWYQRARALRPDDPTVLSALGRLIDSETHPQALFEVLESLSEQLTDVPSRVRLWARMAKLVDERLDRPEDAVHWWTQVRRVDPNHPEALEALERLFERTQQWTELADLLESQLTDAKDERTMLRIQRRLGLVRGTRLGSLEEAVSAWTEILKRNPNDVEAVEALCQIFRESGRWTDLVAGLRKLIPLQTSSAGVKEIRFELAEVFLTKLDSRDEAIESAKRVLDVGPHTVTELKRLEEIFVATGAYGEAVKVMNARAAYAETRGQRIEILFDIARVFEEQIGRRAGAVAAYEQVLDLEPSSVKAYEALAAAYESHGDYRKLGELYNRRLQVTEVPEERRRLLFSIIQIQEKWLGQPELAFTVACRAFGEDGADAEAQAIAERLADETDNWDLLAEVYEEQVDLVPATRAVELRRRLAEIRLDRLGELEEAERQFRIVLSMRADDEVARDRLIALYTQQERWSALVDQLSDRVDLSADVEEKKRLLRQIAQLHEVHRFDHESAVAALQRVLDLDPDDGLAASELARIFRSQDQWQPLLYILERRLERVQTLEEQLDLRTEIGGVWAQGLRDIPRAIEAYRDALELDERYAPALAALEQLLTQEERWGELVDNYERQAASAQSDAESISLLTKIATIHEERFRDLNNASRTLIRILELDPEHRPTLMALTRVWREAGEWSSLIEALERQIELTLDPVQQVPLLRQVGEVHLRQLEQVDQAEEAFNRALAADPNDTASLHAMGDLYERHGNWFQALEMLRREAELRGNEPTAVHLYYRSGKISEDMLSDRSAARAAYERALELDGTYTPAIRALRLMLAADGQHTEAIQLQAQEARHTPEPAAQAELYWDAAEAALREFDDVAQALRLLDKALEAHPESLPALRLAGDLLFSEERWVEAESVLERLSEVLHARDEHAELGRTYYRLAYISEKLEADQRALERYLAAYELEATYLPTLEGLAASLLRAERWSDAMRIFHTILLQHRSSLTDAEVVDLYCQIGELALRLGQTDRAKTSFSKALELDRRHAPTLRALARLAEEEAAWEEAYDYRERLIAALDGHERFEALIKQAELCEEYIREPYRAIDAYIEARRIKPLDVPTLRALARLFQETSQVPRQVQALEELAAALDDQVQRRGALVQLAEVHFRQRRDPLSAVKVLNQALDLDPMYIDAFQRIEQILFETRNWKVLEENYLRMIRRIPKDQRKARLVLWKSLGDLYSKALKNEDGARTAYEVVLSRLDPEAHDIALKLAGIYGKREESAPQAISLYQRVLPFVDDPAEPARRLFELYHAVDQLDRAFCALAALILMRAATEEEAKAYALLLKRTTSEPQRAITDSMWRGQVIHPLCRNALSDVLSVVYRGAPNLFDDAIKGLSLNRRKERVDLSKGRRGRAALGYFSVWQRLSGAMAVGEMEHYHRPGSTQAPRFYPGSQPVLFAGALHEVFKWTSTRQVAWTLGRQMAAARPELAIVRALPPEEVAALIEGAIRIFAPQGSGVDHTLDPRLVETWRLRIQRGLPDRALRALREPVAACVHKKDMKRLSRFLEGAEHSASRAAMLMCGDVVAAEQGLGESDHLVGVSFRGRVRQLMLFVLSEEHFLLRENLGLAIAR